jgi:ATP-binding cassette, subfamily B, bacterial MsbA
MTEPVHGTDSDRPPTHDRMGRFVIDREGLRFLWQYAKPRRRTLATSFGVAVVLAGLSGLLAWSVKQVVQSLTQGGTAGTVVTWVVVAMVVVVLNSVLEVVNRLMMTTLFARISQEIRIDLFREIQDNPIAFHTHIRSGELASLIGNDVQSAAAGVLETFSALWQHPATFLFLVGLMLYLNPWITLIALVLLPLLSACVTWISRRARDAHMSFMDNQSKLMGVMIESITNVRQVKALGMEVQRTEQLASRGESLIHYLRRATLLMSLVSPVTDIINGTAISLMALLAYWQIQHGYTTPGAVAGCLMAAIGLKKPMKGLSQSVVELQRSFAAVRRITWALGKTDRRAGLPAVEGPVRRVTIEDVSFSYDGRRPVLSGIGLELRYGERVALIGSSGAGKTTLLDLITGFYPCTAGRILADDRDLAALDLKSWRRQIGIVSQEPFLFDATIEENIRYGNPEADPAQIAKAAHRAGCDEMFARLPEGLKTRVGERGCRLSGGERKRVALARALVRPISIIVLDEATSELDPEMEESVLRVIDTLAADMLVLNVSHRPSILRHCDRALVLEDGTIRETTPAEILKAMEANGDCVRVQPTS